MAYTWDKPIVSDMIISDVYFLLLTKRVTYTCHCDEQIFFAKIMSMNNVCNTCFKKSFSMQIKCTICHDKYHMKCLSLNRSDTCETDMWYCPPCLQSIFVYNHYDEDQDFFAAVLEGILDHTFRLHEINSKVFHHSKSTKILTPHFQK